jgi:hypothetical protein
LNKVHYAAHVLCLEDKIVQQAVATVLEAIYQEDFLGFSYGFRPGRGQHDALDALHVGILWKRVNWVLDADILSVSSSTLSRTSASCASLKNGSRSAPSKMDAEHVALWRSARRGDLTDSRERLTKASRDISSFAMRTNCLQ